MRYRTQRTASRSHSSRGREPLGPIVPRKSLATFSNRTHVDFWSMPMLSRSLHGSTLVYRNARVNFTCTIYWDVNPPLRNRSLTLISADRRSRLEKSVVRREISIDERTKRLKVWSFPTVSFRRGARRLILIHCAKFFVSKSRCLSREDERKKKEYGKTSKLQGKNALTVRAICSGIRG